MYSIDHNIDIETGISDMEFLEVLTEGLERVLMVRGGGREVITIYSWIDNLLCPFNRYNMYLYCSTKCHLIFLYLYTHWRQDKATNQPT